MQQYTTSQIQKSISTLVKDLPFEIIIRGVVVAKVVAPDDVSSDTKAYIEYLESQLGIKEEVTTDVTTKPSIDDLRKMIDIGGKEEKYLPVRCRWHLGCNEMSVALAEHGYWEDGEWMSKQDHLCQKHIDFVKNDKAQT